MLTLSLSFSCSLSLVVSLSPPLYLNFFRYLLLSLSVRPVGVFFALRLPQSPAPQGDAVHIKLTSDVQHPGNIP